jgi:hypothetical protein
VVDHLERRRAARRRAVPAPVRAGDDLVAAVGEPVDEAAQRSVRHRPEAPRHVLAVALDAQVLRARGVVVQADLDEDVTARDVLRQR